MPRGSLWQHFLLSVLFLIIEILITTHDRNRPGLSLKSSLSTSSFRLEKFLLLWDNVIFLTKQCGLKRFRVTLPQNVLLDDNELVLHPWFFLFMFINIDETVREDRNSLLSSAVDYQ